MMAEAYAPQSEDRQAFSSGLKTPTSRGGDDLMIEPQLLLRGLQAPATALSAVLFVLQVEQLVKINGH